MGSSPAGTRSAFAVALALLVSAFVLAACGGGSGDGASTALPQGSRAVDLDPAEFTTAIDNPYWPMRPGSRWVYRETDGRGGVQRVEVTVTGRTKRIADGIEARVVRDVVTEGGDSVEVTSDWYAQDADGNVWYLGERTAEYDGGRVASRAGSWEAGVDGAEPGIAMPADPRIGMRYRQEHYAGQAEDMAEVLSVREQAEVPLGHFTDVVVTREFTALEPRVVEYKLYARAVGQVLALDVSGAAGREELVNYTEAVGNRGQPNRGTAG